MDELKEYFDNHRTYKIPYKYKPPSGFHLHGWVHRQVKNKSKLSTEQIKKLDELDTFWADNQFVDEWEEKFQALQKFVESNKFARPAENFIDESGATLGVWVKGQRTRFKKGKLAKDKIKKLESLPGWTWDVLETQWRRHMKHQQKLR